MERIVVAAKAGTQQPWVADAAVQLAKETGASVAVVSVDGVELEALSPTPRSEFREAARQAAEAVAERIRAAGVEATAEVRAGKVVPGILVFAEEQAADLIIVSGTGRGPVASRVLGSVPTELIQRSRRPVLVISPPNA